MSGEQLSALLAKLKDDAGLREKIKEAAQLDDVLAIAKDAGFEVRAEDWLRYQEKQNPTLSDNELESVAGGNNLQEKDPTNPYTSVCIECHPQSPLSCEAGGVSAKR